MATVSTRLAHAGARLLESALGSLPPRALLRLADAAGSLWYALSPARRRIVDENLRIAFGPDLDGPARARVGRASCRALARVFAEVALADRLFGSRRACEARLRFTGDWDALRADAAKGRGGVIVTGHLGNWEVGAFGVRHQGVPLRAVARPVDNAVLESFLTRRRGGADRVIRKVGGLKDVLRTVKEGQWVALLADQNAGRHGIFVPFFGLTASTFPTPAALSARTGAPVYLGVCLRQPGVARFEIHLERLEAPAGGLTRGEGVEEMIRRLNERLEHWVRRAPAQYNWAHRRWKTRPPGRDETEPGQPSYARLWPRRDAADPVAS